MISTVFIERPRFAMVVSVVITLAGVLALLSIPVTQYPDITPPSVRVSASYAGASAEVVADSVGAPIEAAVNGVENMLYMSSSSSDNGRYSLSITFEVGTDPDIAQVNVQNRIQQAASKLPSEVTRQGVTVRTRSSDRLLMLSFSSPGGSYDPLFISNYVSINVRDALVRVNGVSDATVLGALDYSMRVWMNPERMTALGLTAGDVSAAIESQNIQATAGSIGTAPAADNQQVQYTLRAKGRLRDVAESSSGIARSPRSGRGNRCRVADQSPSCGCSLNVSP
jgi:multidrug efflux pump subunit AcrB